MMKWTAVLAVVLAWALVGCSGERDVNGVKVRNLKTLEVDLGNGATMKFVLIPKGKFQMGSTGSEQGHVDKEGPRHEVTITRPFWLAVTEVTQKQYEAVMGENPAYTKGPNNPVENVSWQDAQKFCAKVFEKTKKHARLPTEAEWEYACRAGTDTTWPWGNSAADIGRYAVYKDNAAGVSVTTPVQTKLPNPWGLYDMIGNVWELTQDTDSIKYNAAENVDPAGSRDATEIKVARGGSMNTAVDASRPAYRLAAGVAIKLFDLGFRVAVDAE